MIHVTKANRDGRPIARVRFSLPASIWADSISLVGEFNAWNSTSHQLTQDKVGTWTLSLDLEPNQSFAFAYVCDGRWLSDDQADGWIWDADGRHVFLVLTDLNRVRAPVPSRRRNAMPHEVGALAEEATWSSP